MSDQAGGLRGIETILVAGEGRSEKGYDSTEALDISAGVLTDRRSRGKERRGAEGR